MMKKITSLFLLFFLFQFAHSQEIIGQWNGVLKVPGGQLRLVFNVSETENGYSSTMDSPDQGAKGIPTTSTSFEDGVLKITIANARIEYQGTLGEDNKIVGTFTQAGQSFPMDLSREVVQKEVPKRPQEPQKPFPYYSEDIKFDNAEAGITLAGTLTLPEETGIFPAVVLITGSGPQNRDEEILGHKPFLVISDYLTRNGIAVLRFDDRGTAASGGNFGTATSNDFATDVQAGVEFLKTRKEINKDKIGLIGHSEGGLIAPMVANEDKDIAFLVLLAGTGIPGGDLLLLQQRLIGASSGMTPAQLDENEKMSSKTFEIVRNALSEEDLKRELAGLMIQTFRSMPADQVPEGLTEGDFVNAQMKQLTSPWMINFIKYDPAPTLEKIKIPVLAVNGSNDLQVPPKENLGAIKAALEKAGNEDFTIQELPGLNHLFQESSTGAISEYETIEQTFSPDALELILKWIQSKVN